MTDSGDFRPNRAVMAHSRRSGQVLESSEDAAAALRDLAGGKTYLELYREHFDVCNSQGAWHGWLTGRRDPRLSKFLAVVHALGGEVVVRRRSLKKGRD